MSRKSGDKSSFLTCEEMKVHPLAVVLDTTVFGFECELQHSLVVEFTGPSNLDHSLGTNIGGTFEIVIDGVTGLLHPPGNEGQPKLIENIRSLVDDRKRARSLGKAGLRRVSADFSADRFYHELAEVLARVMTKADAVRS